MKRLISINLRESSNDNIREFCEINKLGELSAKELIEDKSNGFRMFWLEVLDDVNIRLVAYSKIFDKKKITFNSEKMKGKYDGKLDNFTKYDPNDKSKNKIEYVGSDNKIEESFTVDDILDKIGAYGMGSLTKEELKFLKSESK